MWQNLRINNVISLYNISDKLSTRMKFCRSVQKNQRKILNIKKLRDRKNASFAFFAQVSFLRCLNIIEYLNLVLYSYSKFRRNLRRNLWLILLRFKNTNWAHSLIHLKYDFLLILNMIVKKVILNALHIRILHSLT